MDINIPACTMTSENKVDRSDQRQQVKGAYALPANVKSRRLIWSSRKPTDWEILVYQDGESWEACFFRWPIHHEHATGTSFDSVKNRAEQRIHAIEERRLKTAVWR